MPLFDAYIFIDWSARNRLGPQRPAPDNIWIGKNYSSEKYCRSRNECIEYVIEILKNHIREKHRVLIGYDFPYGYPKGFANSLGHNSGPQSWWENWVELSRRIRDESNNNNNRFQVANDLNAKIGGSPQGPFWGRPQINNINNLQYLNTHAPGFPYQAANGISLTKLRIVESRLPGVQETWGLYGAGRVGSQALVGIPRLHHLRTHEDLSPVSKVWPFETGFTQEPGPKQGPFILHAEIWPGVISQETNLLLAREPKLIRDRAQVRAMCQWATKLDERNELGLFFGSPQRLSEKQIQECIEEEGWILGAR
jgi:hypothetical protein